MWSVWWILLGWGTLSVGAEWREECVVTPFWGAPGFTKCQSSTLTLALNFRPYTPAHLCSHQGENASLPCALQFVEGLPKQGFQYKQFFHFCFVLLLIESLLTGKTSKLQIQSCTHKPQTPLDTGTLFLVSSSVCLPQSFPRGLLQLSSK